MSPAAMYSFAFSTIALYSSGVVLERGVVDRRGVGVAAAPMVERPVERVDDLAEPLLARA